MFRLQDEPRFVVTGTTRSPMLRRRHAGLGVLFPGDPHAWGQGPDEVMRGVSHLRFDADGSGLLPPRLLGYRRGAVYEAARPGHADARPAVLGRPGDHRGGRDAWCPGFSAPGSASGKIFSNRWLADRFHDKTFMPDSMQRCRSSAKALAVRAMIGVSVARLAGGCSGLHPGHP